MTLSSLQSKILEEFDEKYRSFELCNEVSITDRDRLKAFISSALQRQLDGIQGEVEGMKRQGGEFGWCKGWHHKGDMICDQECRYYDQALSDILTLLK